MHMGECDNVKRHFQETIDLKEPKLIMMTFALVKVVP